MMTNPTGHWAVAAILLTTILASSAFAQRAASVERGSIWNDARLRERVYNRTIDRYMENLSQAYELTDEQKTLLSSKLDELKQRQEAYSTSSHEEISQLNAKMGELWRMRQAGETVDEQEIQAVGERMRELWQNAPLLNAQRVLGEVEKLLPAEQAAQGRRKWEADRQERIREWTERFSAYRQPAGSGSGYAAGSWEQFVEAFCREFGLDEAQRATAFSVLRDVQARRDRYVTSRADEIEAAQQGEDFRYRRERLDQVMQPISSLYEELRTRLDRIPTSAQIDAVRRRATTQPAEGDTVRRGAVAESPSPDGPESAAAATRPSDMIRAPAPPVRQREFRPARDEARQGRFSD
jgi:hypothetical protein